jgi:hypothetical protein
LEVMARMRNAFNPTGLLNPEKIFPSKKGCGEIHSAPLAAPARPQA